MINQTVHLDSTTHTYDGVTPPHRFHGKDFSSGEPELFPLEGKCSAPVYLTEIFHAAPDEAGGSMGHMPNSGSSRRKILSYLLRRQAASSPPTCHAELKNQTRPPPQ